MNQELENIFNAIMDYQMNYVQLARTTEPYKLAEKGLELLKKNKETIDVNRIGELIDIYIEKEMPNAKVPFHYEAEAAAGFKYFKKWLKNE